jgi:porin
LLQSIKSRLVLTACALCLTGFAAGAAEDPWVEKATGNWGGARAALQNRGIEFNLAYIGETLSILRGGVRQGSSFEGRFEAHVDTDLEKLIGWRGAKTHVRGFQIHKGRYNAADLVQSLADPSNIDAEPTTRLFSAWIAQEFGKAGSIAVGQLAADDEYLVGRTAGGLINGTFGWAAIVAANMPGGGPAYPLTAPGVRLKLNPTEEFSILAAALAGHVGGKDCNDLNSQVCNKHGGDFGWYGGTLWVGSVDYEVNREKDAKGLAFALRLGGWYHTGNKFADQRYGVAADGSVIQSAGPIVQKFYHGYDWGLFGVLDQMLWRSGERSVSVFTRGGYAPSDHNIVNWYVDGGIGFKGLFAGRADDTLTFGIAHSRISKHAAAADRDSIEFSGVPIPIRSAETVYEASYIYQITPWWSLQPDIQYIVRPGGGAPHPDNSSRRIGDTLIVGARTTITF